MPRRSVVHYTIISAPNHRSTDAPGPKWRTISQSLLGITIFNLFALPFPFDSACKCRPLALLTGLGSERECPGMLSIDLGGRGIDRWDPAAYGCWRSTRRVRAWTRVIIAVLGHGVVRVYI